MGVHKDLTYAEYEALPGWRWSHVKLLDDGSPKALRYAIANPKPGTASQTKLRAIHAAVFEPHNLLRDFSFYAERRAGKAYQEHLELNPGTSALNPKEHAEVLATAAAILSNPDVLRFMREGDPEVCLTWIDERTGLPCKARLDWFGPLALLDLKTLGTVHERRVGGLIARHKYHGQMGHYTAGLEALGIEVPPVFLVVAEGKGAQETSLAKMGPHGPHGLLYLGRQLRDRLMAQLAECVENDHWPGRHEEPYMQAPPMYLLPRDEDGELGNDFEDFEEVL